MKKEKLTMAAYEAPVASVIDVMTEGILCSSTENGIEPGSIVPGEGEFIY